jgi:hypothetical protein
MLILSDDREKSQLTRMVIRYKLAYTPANLLVSRTSL